MQILKLLFPSKEQSCQVALLLLIARVVFSLLMAVHGFQKLEAFDVMSTQFPDPLGVGNEVSLALAIFGELVCAIAVIFGLLTRLALIPMAFTMFIAFFVAHGGSTANGGELSLVYLLIFVLLIFAGPGKFSIDGLLGNKLIK